jgi:hypothetical protein
MSLRFHGDGAAIPVSDSDRRAAGRVLQQGVACNLGIVIDMSAGGMRVLCTRGHHGQMLIRLQSDCDVMSLLVETAWSHRAGFRRHMVGLRFLDVDAETARRLAAIALSHRLREAI